MYNDDFENIHSIDEALSKIKKDKVIATLPKIELNAKNYWWKYLYGSTDIINFVENKKREPGIYNIINMNEAYSKPENKRSKPQEIFNYYGHGTYDHLKDAVKFTDGAVLAFVHVRAFNGTFAEDEDIKSNFYALTPK